MLVADFGGVSAGIWLSVIWSNLKEIIMLITVKYAVCGWCGVALCGGRTRKTSD